MSRAVPKDNGPCRYCGASSAPYGFRMPGPTKDIPVSRKAYVWTCELADCQNRARKEVGA